ncbi:MAG: LPS export ABC transporter periplasmic protein LptC [endosymbiont of Galathealinum brachiosum]|uniref:LPS export ABC transporter periplasmic protein LptC n=1 Tax=endosymbiont of Galathealinum brachiosum TaxID=2200906 RepID=A0A370DAP2_9GAMM|nr:MAG: LPS export ABC transporter periplasmic protein LptC [endosymbiont of Galathealinum brachiosum]
MRTYITLAIFILIAIGSFWFLQDLTKEPITEKKPDSQFPDYFMENFSVTNMNAQGQPEYILKAKKMLHFSDDDRAELEQPFINFLQTNTNITLQSSRAVFLEKENIIHLHDKVIIHRAASKNQSELSIYTDYLKIDTQSHIAETNLAAKLKTPEVELNTIGLVLDNKQGTVKLKSQVRGIYEATN